MEKKVNGGVIKYKLPNVSELLILLGEMGYGLSELSFLDEKKENGEASVSSKHLVFMGKIIQKIEPFIENVDILRADGVKINTFKALLENASYLSELNEIGMEIMGALGVSSEKKA